MTQQRQLAGGYVDEIVDALIDSALTNIPCLIIGAPGWGKTTIVKSLSRQIFGKRGEDWFFKQINPTTPPVALEGATDTVALLEESVWRINTDGTPFDPRMKGVSLDEVGRGDDMLYDLAMGILKREDLGPDQQPVVWLTSNFMPASERAEAFRDRVGKWRWVNANGVELDDVLDAQMNAIGVEPEVIRDDIPTWDDIQKIRALPYTDKSRRAVKEVISRLKVEMTQGVEYGGTTWTWAWHPRLTNYWQVTLHRLSCYYHGTNDYDKCHEKAVRALEYTKVLMSEDEALAWRQCVVAIADQTALAIEQVMNEALRLFRDIQAKVVDGSIQRNELIEKLGTPMQKSLNNLDAIDPNEEDERVATAKAELQQTYFEIVQGRNPFA